MLDSAGIGNGGPGAISDEVHGKLIDLFRLYLVIGGMLEAVQTYLDSSHDLSVVCEVLNDLVRLCREDIAKYANGRSLQVKAIYDEIPQQLAKENKRFQLNSLRKRARYERFANDFAWLVGAKTALKAVNVTEPRFMLARALIRQLGNREITSQTKVKTAEKRREKRRKAYNNLAKNVAGGERSCCEC